MTAENRLGEILELPASPGSRDKGGLLRSSRAASQEQPVAAATLSATLASASTSDEHPRAPVARTPGPASVSSWRASSYDLLHGLTVRDVSENIPQRMFEALFSPDPADVPPPGRKRR